MKNATALAADPVLNAWFASLRDLRRRRRARLELPARLWPFDPRFRHLKEVRRIRNFTRDGLYFTTDQEHYFVGMKLLVTFPFCRQAPAQRDFLGKVVRVETLTDDTFGVALRFIY